MNQTADPAPPTANPTVAADAEQPSLRRELYAILVLYGAIAIIPLLIGFITAR